MTKKINLPIKLYFPSEGEAESFCSAAEKIIPKLKSEPIGEGQFVFYTRKDKNYRLLVGENPTPETEEGNNEMPSGVLM